MARAQPCAGVYSFTFQGQEKDDELHGATGTSYSYEYRMHDPRVGRFLSIDPLAAKYPFYSPYAFSGNRVIDAVELEGLEPAGYQYKFSGYIEFGMSVGLQLGITLEALLDAGFVFQGTTAEGNTRLGFEYLFTDQKLSVSQESDATNIAYKAAVTILNVYGASIGKQGPDGDQKEVSSAKGYFVEVQSVEGEEDETTWNMTFSIGAEVRLLIGAKLNISGQMSYAPLDGTDPPPSPYDQTMEKKEIWKFELYDFDEPKPTTSTPAPTPAPSPPTIGPARP